MALYKYADNKLQLLAGSSMDCLPVGTIISNIQSEIDDNFLLCDGSEFDTSKYPVLYSILGTNTVPDLRGRTLFGANTETVGDKTVGKLPNISGNITAWGGGTSSSGAMYTSSYGNWSSANASSGGAAKLNVYMNASRSSSIYQSTDRVVPASMYVNWFIKATPSASNALDLNALYEYTRNQNVLSDLEDFEVSTTNTEVEYDGTIYFTGASSTSYPKQIYINDAVAGHVDCNTSRETKIEVTVSFEVKKGDLVRFTNVANSETGWGAPKPQARWYKLRDYTGR